MEEENLFHGRYRLIRLLGRGNFAEVWLANDTMTQTDVALKIYAPATGLDDDGLNIFAREFAIVLNANHKNLLKPLHYDTCDRKPYLVLPYCSNGSAKKRIGIFKEKEIWLLLHDVASGLNFLHGMNPPVIHQDIKPDNIMQNDNGDYMLADFGISSHCKSALRRSVSDTFVSAGTTAYMAPERFGKNGNVPIMASDIYSLGATAFELLTGDAPFGNDGGLVQKKGAEIPELNGTFSNDLRKVIRLCLSAEPWKRPTAEQLEAYTAHGLKGEHFRVAGEKTILQRFWPVAAVMVLIICGALYMTYTMRQEAIARSKELAEIHYNDSVASLIREHLVTADNAFEVGKKQEEFYERSLITAWEEYNTALRLMKELTNREMLNEKTLAEKSLTGLDTLLHQAYESMMDKAAFFSDDPISKAEFEERANRIANILNIPTISIQEQ